MERKTKKAAKTIHKTAKPNTLVVYAIGGEKIEEIPTIFHGPVKQGILVQAVNMYLANKRQGLAATKTRGEVSGGGKKPWRQKGTGRARVGSTRSPLWRHGGIVFGPHTRDFHYQIPAKIRNAALISALNEKGALDAIIVIDKVTIDSPKTKEMQKILNNFKISDKVLFVSSKFSKNIQIAAKNIPLITLSLTNELNALDVLKSKKVVFEKDALKDIAKRLDLTIKNK